MSSTAREDETVLVFAPTGRDAELTRALLERDGLQARICPEIEGLCRSVAAGAGVALVSEEALCVERVGLLKRVINDQPAWSDFPIVVFSASADARARGLNDSLRALGNVTFLDRPVHVRSMLAAVHASIRSRRRQYQARRAIESRDQFLAMLGHELRNPLAAIRLAADLLDRDGDDARRARHRAVITRQARHLGRLVDDLLDVARVTYGKIVLQREPVDLTEVARACFQSFEHSALEQRLSYTLEVEDGPVLVVGDRVRLEQVLGNLIANAIKYTPEGGSVAVRLTARGGEVSLRVVDTGVGMAPHMIERVFDLFAQADRSLDRTQGGLGLGLTLVRNLVQLHGGKVEARSEGLGRGCELRVTLPLLSAELRDPGEPRASELARPQRQRIVLVEDNEDLRALQHELLVRAGHEVQSASDGPDGVAKILDVRPDVAFVDLGLPGFDGFEVARRVRAANALDVMLVAVSGYGQSEDRRRALAAGFDAHLIKPVGIEDLTASIASRRPH